MKRQKLIKLFSCEVWKVTDTLSLFFAFLTGSFVILLQVFVIFFLSFLQVRMKKPVLRGTEVEIIRSGQFYTLLLGKHISISWDKGSRLLVHISASYRVSQSASFKLICSRLRFLIPCFTAHFFLTRRVECAACVVTLMGMSTMI